MPRPVKRRRVCRIPHTTIFGSLEHQNKESEVVIMTVEELESLRLMDLEQMDQEQCAEMMGVARSTFQRIYTEAKKKVADSLVNGKVLKIQGGNYQVCNEDLPLRPCTSCARHRYRHGKM